MIDFAADWCVPCHELELQVFPDRAVIAAAKPFDAYKADLTHGDTPASKRFGVSGVPTVIFLGAGGQEARRAARRGFRAGGGVCAPAGRGHGVDRGALT